VLPRIQFREPLVDAHTHIYACEALELFIEAADLYGIGRIASMTPLSDLPEVRARLGERVAFIAIPNWKDMGRDEAFRTRWIRDLAAFRESGARFCKFWMAPRAKKEHGLSVDDPFVRPVVTEALDLGFEFMIHVADPSVWWAREDKYAGDAVIGGKRDQYPQLEWLLETVAPRTVIGVHMAGTIEDPEFLQQLLDRFDNLMLDSSATKWIVREVARQPDAVRDFFVRNSERILFGSDLVVRDAFDTFDHYASRYWAQRTMWETAYRGESPIEDPDGEDPPRLAGMNLPPDVLRNLYVDNAARVGFAGAAD